MKPAVAGQTDVALFLPSLAGGGAERVFVELANEFAAQRLRADLVLATLTGPYLDEVSEGVRIVDLGAARVVGALPGLVRYLRAARPAAMLSALDHANVVAILANRLAGRPTRGIVSIRSMPSAVHADTGLGKSCLVAWLTKPAYRLADGIIANSRAVALDLAQVTGIHADRIHVVPNPLDLGRIDKLAAAPVGHDWLSDGAPPVILGVGSLTPFKDFGTLLRAFAVLRLRRACRLVILGDGPQRASLELLAAKQGVAEDVAMPGFMPNPFAWMRRAAVLVSASTTEGCPNALMQALAVGTPVVSTNAAGGSAEILEHGRWGRLVPVGDAAAMAAAIDACLDEPRDRGDGRRRAADFAHDRVARQFLDVLLPAGPRRHSTRPETQA